LGLNKRYWHKQDNLKYGSAIAFISKSEKGISRIRGNLLKAFLKGFETRRSRGLEQDV
jgi:hypothetical protein